MPDPILGAFSTPFSAASPSQKAPIHQMLEDFLFFQHKPLFAIDFDAINTISVAGATANELVIASYSVQAQYEGVVKWVGHDGSQPAIFNNAVWFLRINNIAVPSWAGINVQKGPISNPTPETIILTSNDVVTLSVVIATGTGITFPIVAGARLKGWIWSQERRRKT